MPVLGMLRASFASQQPFAGLTIACCLHVTAETAVLVRALTAGGARVHLAASNPLSTQDDIAAALAAEPGVIVQARSGVDRSAYYEHIHQVLDSEPDLVMDDGGDLVNTLHEARAELVAGVRGGCEATATGAARLRRMAAAGSLGFPMIAAELSAITRMIDHKYGTGQSVLDGILRATNTLVAGKTVVVAGFGPCGSGIFDVEIDVATLTELAIEVHPAVRPHAAEYVLADGRRLILLAEGRVVNLVAAEGNPAAVMDTSFAVQALALAWLAGAAQGQADVSARPGATAGLVIDVPAPIDAQVARLTLASLGTRIDELTEAQQRYLESWRQGS
jgi:adenosylhomocysteinase